MALRVSVHHGLDAACLEGAARTARLAAHHQNDRQSRLAFPFGERRRRQVDERLARLEMRFRGWNVDFAHRSVRWNVPDGAVGHLSAPLGYGDEVLAFDQSGQIGLAVGIVAEQRSDGGVFAVRLVDANRRRQYGRHDKQGRDRAHHPVAQSDMRDRVSDRGKADRHPCHDTRSQSDAKNHEHVGQQPCEHVTGRSGNRSHDQRQYNQPNVSVLFALSVSPAADRADQQRHG